MNSYLIQIATDLPQLRKILALTQKELAEELGISRPTLVKIEQSPDRLTKIIALGLYVVANARLQEDLEKIDSLKNYDYEKIEEIPDLLKRVGNFNTVTKASVSGVASSTIPLNILQSSKDFLESSLTGIWKSIPSFIKGKKEEEENEKSTIDESKMKEELPNVIDDFLRGLEDQIELKNKSCLELLNLEKWDTNRFLTEIEKGSLS